MTEVPSPPTIALSSDDTLAALRRWHWEGRGAALATVLSTWGSSPRPVGSRLAVRDNGAIVGSVSGGCVEGAVVGEALEVIADGAPRLLEFGIADADAWAVGLSCGGRIEVFVERLSLAKLAILEAAAELGRARQRYALVTMLDTGAAAIIGAGIPQAEYSLPPRIAAEATRRLTAGESGVVEHDGARFFIEVHLPPPRLLIVGAVHIAQALFPMAMLAGWDVAIIDPRLAFATHERFPGVPMATDWPDAALRRLGVDALTAVVTLSHDPKLDEPALVAALRSDAFYVGALGSRRTIAARAERLRARGTTDAELARLHAPVGLAIGAVTPAEIAVAILAELTIAHRRSPGRATAPRIAAIVLAAGRSRRMGRNKLVEPVGGVPMVARAADAALGSRANPVVVVTGHEADRIAATVAGRSLILVHNSDHAEGIASSIRAGIAALPPNIDGAVIVLGDMPFITGTAIDRLIDAFDPSAGHSLCVPARDGRRGNPVLWGRKFFGELRALEGDSGGRQLFARHATEIVEVPIDDAAIETDIDTPEALAAAVNG